MGVSAKTRRHSGRITSGCYGIKQELLSEEGIEPQIYWDDWTDYRDGFRYNNDRTKIRSRFMWGATYLDVEKWNKRLKKLIFRRRARKDKRKAYKLKFIGLN